MERLTIDNPGDFLLQHDLTEEHIRIVDVTEVPVDSHEMWINITRTCVSDDHTDDYQPVRFRYTFADRQNGLLMIQQDGQVSVNGGVCQEDTYFMVKQSIDKKDTYRIICIHGINKNKILYMDGKYLKTKIYEPPSDDNRADTAFRFEVKGNNLWEIKSKQKGYVLQFDKETGLYLPADDNDQVDGPPLFCNPDIGPRLQAFVPKQIKIETTV